MQIFSPSASPSLCVFIVHIERVAQRHRWAWLKAGALQALSAAPLTSTPWLRRSQPLAGSK